MKLLSKFKNKKIQGIIKLFDISKYIVSESFYVEFAQLASQLAITCSKPKSVITHDLYGRLNICLV